MLTDIYIRNYLLVPEQRLAFGPGMTVLSGETGAGKSILVAAIALIFGDASSGLEPYEPGRPIYLEATFDISGNSEVQGYLREQGFEPEAELCLAREISIAGKSTFFLGGRKVSASLLRELKPLMIDFHHQRDQQRLLAPAYQIRILDLYARDEDTLSAFGTLYRGLNHDLKRLEALRAEAERNRQLRELYQYQYEELDKAQLRSGEDRELQSEFELLSHAFEINETAQAVAYGLYESEDSVHSRLGHAASQIERFAQVNDQLKEFGRTLRDCLELISDTASGLSCIAQTAIPDPERLEQIQTRLDLINSLLHKHKAGSIDELLGIFAQREEQINAMANLEEEIGSLESAINSGFLSLRKTGEKLSAIRMKAAAELSVELRGSIALLSIPEAEFKIKIDKKVEEEFSILKYLESCSEQGQDSCQFLFSANRGRDLKPLSAVASGGELSRILLAIKKVLADRIGEKLMILDEIDAGIGGRTADVVAQFIFQLARRNRILCITHLAQIAAIAHQQVALVKDSGKKGSVILMNPLDPRQRLEELARMLSGEVSGISLRHAEELIKKYDK